AELVSHAFNDHVSETLAENILSGGLCRSEYLAEVERTFRRTVEEPGEHESGKNQIQRMGRVNGPVERGLQRRHR
ncbi:hypothetical protein ACKGJN_16910, partial [Gillisia sp. Q332]|uniref:hypothetical protein n=1 Tax=Gillisia xinjiangensis TaxID=3384765 RepID=UPI00391C3B50